MKRKEQNKCQNTENMYIRWHKTKGKRRDYNVCQVCGSTVKPEGHHMIQYLYGGAANDENIITLCQKCHKQVHRGNIDIMKF